MLMTVDLRVSVVVACGRIEMDVRYIAVICRHINVGCHVSNDARRRIGHRCICMSSY
jgi:hypothetical protein